MKIKSTVHRKFKDWDKPHAYKIAYGGRSSTKSWTIATLAIERALMQKTFFLCTREIQKSIKQSVHRLLAQTIDRMGLSEFFDVQATTIICKLNGSQFVYEGLRTNPDSIKSMEGIDIAIVEEAANVSAESWEILIPTVRKANSEIWVIFNPRHEEDDTWQRFLVHTPPNALLVNINYTDNPYWTPKEEQARLHLLEFNKDIHDHVYLGKFCKEKNLQVIKDDWFKYYQDVPTLTKRVIYADTAQKAGEHNDYTVFQCWGFTSKGIYLLDQVRAKVESPELRQLALEFWGKHSKQEGIYPPCRLMKVEDKVSGTGLIQELKRLSHVNIEGIQRSRNKAERMIDLAPKIKDGFVYLPICPNVFTDAAWVYDFKQEAKLFRLDMSHDHDDQIDPMLDAIEDMLGMEQQRWNLAAALYVPHGRTWR